MSLYFNTKEFEKDLYGLKVVQLKEKLKQRTLSTKGVKSELVERLVKFPTESEVKKYRMERALTESESWPKRKKSKDSRKGEKKSEKDNRKGEKKSGKDSHGKEKVSEKDRQKKKKTVKENWEETLKENEEKMGKLFSTRISNKTLSAVMTEYMNNSRKELRKLLPESTYDKVNDILNDSYNEYIHEYILRETNLEPLIGLPYKIAKNLIKREFENVHVGKYDSDEFGLEEYAYNNIRLLVEDGIVKDVKVG